MAQPRGAAKTVDDQIRAQQEAQREYRIAQQRRLDFEAAQAKLAHENQADKLIVESKSAIEKFAARVAQAFPQKQATRERTQRMETSRRQASRENRVVANVARRGVLPKGAERVSINDARMAADIANGMHPTLAEKRSLHRYGQQNSKRIEQETGINRNDLDPKSEAAYLRIVKAVKEANGAELTGDGKEVVKNAKGELFARPGVELKAREAEHKLGTETTDKETAELLGKAAKPGTERASEDAGRTANARAAANAAARSSGAGGRSLSGPSLGR